MNRFQKAVCRQALDQSHKLSEKDIGFIKNLRKYYQEKELQPAQNKWLNDISQKLNKGRSDIKRSTSEIYYDN